MARLKKHIAAENRAAQDMHDRSGVRSRVFQNRQDNKNKKYQHFYTVKDSHGRKIRKGKQANEFVVDFRV